MQRDYVSTETIADPRSPQFVDQFGALLQERQILDNSALSRARRAQQQSGERFDLVLMRLGLMPDAVLAQALAEFSGLKMCAATEFPDEPLLSDRLQFSFLKANHILPISESPDEVRLAVADPFNVEARAALSFLLDRKLDCVIAPEGEIDRAIERLYGAGRSQKSAPEADLASEVAEEASEEDVRRLEDMASEAPVIKPRAEFDCARG